MLSISPAKGKESFSFEYFWISKISDTLQKHLFNEVEKKFLNITGVFERDFGYGDNCQLKYGDYKKFKNSVCMIPPIETDCEKNWVMIENKIIYKWYPLEVGILVNNKLEIIYNKIPSVRRNNAGQNI